MGVVTMASPAPASLASWFIYDSGPLRTRYGGRYKGEDVALEKCLWFYPEDLEEDAKKEAVSGSEALISFASIFSKDLPCEAVHLEKQRHVYLELEDGLWMVMEVNNPTFQADGSTQYSEDDLDDKALRAVLQQSYDVFRLFNGTMEGIYAKDCRPPAPEDKTHTPSGEAQLRARLAQFFDRWVPMVDLPKANLFNTLSGINFLPVDKQIFLSIQYFVNLTESAFPQILASALLYDNQLVWSGIEHDTMRSIYKIATEATPITTAGRAAKPASGKGPIEMAGAANIRRWAGAEGSSTTMMYLRDDTPFGLREWGSDESGQADFCQLQSSVWRRAVEVPVL